MKDPRYEALARRTVTPEGAREIARAEIASLARLVLRRLRGERSDTSAIRVYDQRAIWEEVLRDFSQTDDEAA